MPSLFNTIRTSIYASVIVFTLICLAMAAQFQQKLAMSELTRFVPFAIFVSAFGLLIFLVLLGSSIFMGARNPISTRIELVSLGVSALLWFILGIFLASSESGEADVECYESEDSTEPIDESEASFRTDQYQAMYRVLNAFALINAVILLLAFLGLLLLAYRRHRDGDQHMWYAPVTSCAWFSGYNKEPPLTTKPERRRPSMREQQTNVLPIAAAHTTRPKPSRHKSTRSGPDESPYTTPVPSRSNTKASGRRDRDYGQHSQGRRPRDIAKVYPSAAGRHGRMPSGSAEAPLMGSALLDRINDGELMDDNPRMQRGRRR